MQKTWIKEFLDDKALNIISIMFPIIVSSFLSLKLFSVQTQIRMQNTEYQDNELELVKRVYNSYEEIDRALLRIIKILFFSFIIFLFSNFIVFFINNTIWQYIIYTIQLTIFVLFFYGLYHMVIIAMDLLIPHN